MHVICYVCKHVFLMLPSLMLSEAAIKIWVCTVLLQTAQRLHAMCQEMLLQQLPEAARPAALAAAGHMVLDTSDTHPQHSAGPHDEDPNAMNIDNAPCTTVAQGVP